MNDRENEGRGQALYRRAKELIPGGTQLLSKRPEMFLPDQWPAYYTTAAGCEVTDLDGNRYLDFSLMGVGSCILGYSDPDVSSAVVDAVRSGNLTTLNVPEEVELAELLVDLHPWADMVRYARSGGEAMAIAVRLARAASGKDIVLFSGYHGWSDWYLSANIADDEALDGHLISGLEPAGVPRELRETAIPFRFNDVAAFSQLVDRYEGRIGAIVLEPIRNAEPTPEFLEIVHRVTQKHGVPLVIDEITAGFRLNVGGAHQVVGWEPDIAVFAKGMSNGHPMAAVIGRRSVMEAAQRSFVSSTYWTDKTGPVAAIATIRKMLAVDAPRLLETVGHTVQTGWQTLIDELGITAHVGGIYPLSHIDFESEPLLWKSVFIQQMLKQGFLATGAVYASIAHTPELVDKYLAACRIVFEEMAHTHRSEGSVQSLLSGPTVHSGFRRLN